MEVLNSKQSKELDYMAINEFGLPSLVLMERAALGIIDFLRINKLNILNSKRKSLIIIGTGNNGGDGLAVARMLFLLNKPVSIILIGNGNKRTEDNVFQLNLVKKLEIEIIDFKDWDSINFKNYDLIIDALFGIGLSRNLINEHKSIIEQVNYLDNYKISIDIPSGIDCNNGSILGVAFKADATVTFSSLKIGLLIDQAIDYVGKIEVINIGIPKKYLKNIKINYLKQNFFNKTTEFNRQKNSYKNNFGRLLLIGGSESMSGAVLLSAKSALYSGIGLLNIIVPKCIHNIVASKLPTAMVTPCNDIKGCINLNNKILDSFLYSSQTIAIGPGLGRNEGSLDFIEYILLNYKGTLILDADALYLISNNLSYLNKSKANIILTPHLGEFSKLSNLSKDNINKDKIEAIKIFAHKYNVTLVLKGAKTIIYKKNEIIHINSTGNPILSRGGTGDILTGILGGLLSKKSDYNNVLLAVYLHGLMGDIAKDKIGNDISISSFDMIKYLKSAINLLYKKD